MENYYAENPKPVDNSRKPVITRLLRWITVDNRVEIGDYSTGRGVNIHSLCRELYMHIVGRMGKYYKKTQNPLALK